MSAVGSFGLNSTKWMENSLNAKRFLDEVNLLLQSKFVAIKHRPITKVEPIFFVSARKFEPI